MKSGVENRDGLVKSRLDVTAGLQFLGHLLRQNVAQEIIGLIPRLLGGGFGLRQLLEESITLDELSPQLEQRHGLLRQATHGLALGWAQLMRFEPDDAERAQGMSFPVDERHAAIEADMRLLRHDRQMLITFMGGQVRHIDEIVRAESSVAHRDLARALGIIGRHAVFRFHPLTPLVHQADQCDGTAADLGRELRHRIEGEFRRRIHDPVEGECRQPIGLIDGGRILHGLAPSGLSARRTPPLSTRPRRNDRTKPTQGSDFGEV